MLDGPFTDLVPSASASAFIVNTTASIKTSLLTALTNKCCAPPPPLMDSPQYFLSSVRIGSFPINVDEIAALHTRPSVVSRQSAGFEFRTSRHSFLISFARFWCLLNQSLIDFVLACDKSPDPA